MLAFTVSPPGAIIYSSLGQFIAADQEHLLLVKPHSIEYYKVEAFDDPPEAEIDIPLHATIIGASKFSLPDSPFENLALLAADLTLIVFSHADNPEGELPFERTVSDNLRNQHVIPSDHSPLFAAVGNYLFISLYPNSLSLITFGGEALEKNEIHFTHFIPTFLASTEGRLIATDLWKSTPLTILDVSRVPELLANPTADSSAALEVVGIEFEGRPFVRGGVFYSIEKDRIRRFNFAEELEAIALPNSTRLLATNLEYFAFADGSLFAFDTDSGQFAEVGSCHGVSRIVTLPGAQLFLVLAIGPALIYSTEAKAVVATFSRAFADLSHSVVLPHSVLGTEKLVVAGQNELVAFGYAQVFDSESITELSEGDALFVADQYLLISKSDGSLLMKGENLAAVEGFIDDDKTVLFATLPQEGTFLQISKHAIVAFGGGGAVVRLPLDVEHAASRGGRIAVSSPASQSVQLLEFTGNGFEAKGTIRVGDDISAVFVTDNGFLIVSTWSKMAVLVFNVDTQQSTTFAESFVVRSFCQIGTAVFMGTSRGDIYAAEITDTGVLREIAHQKVGVSTLALSVVKLGDADNVFAAAGQLSKVVSLVGSELNVFPVVLDDPVHSHAQVSDGSVVLLSTDKLIRGSFSAPKIRKIVKREFGPVIELLCPVDADSIAAVLENGEVVIVDASQFDTITSFRLEPELAYNYVNAFSMGDRTYVQVLVADPKAKKPERFSEPGAVLTYLLSEGSAVLCDNQIACDALPTAVKFSEGLLFLAAGSQVKSFDVKQHPNGQLVFTVVKEVDGPMLASDLVVDHSLVAIFDVFASATLFNRTLAQVAIDQLAKGLVTGLFVGPSLLFVSDVRGNVYLLEQTDDRLITIGRYSIGEKVTSLTKWRAIPGQEFSTVAGVTSAGSILGFRTLSADLAAQLLACQDGLRAYHESSSGISPAGYRAISSPGYREASFGFVDGDLLQTLDDLDDGDKAPFLAEDSGDELPKILSAISAHSAV